VPHPLQYCLWRNKQFSYCHHNGWLKFESNLLLNYCSWDLNSLILFDLLKNTICIPCPINNNFELEASLLQQTPAVIHWPPSHSVTPIPPHDYLSTPWMVQLTPGGPYRMLWEPLVYLFLQMCFAQWYDKLQTGAMKNGCASVVKKQHLR